MTNPSYIVNSELAAERFGTEAVVINIEKGLYFSVQGAALDIYDCFIVPRHADEALSLLAVQLAGSDRALLDSAFQDLLAHELIVQSNLPPQSTELIGANPREFVVPSISVFDDLAEMIALDPVHEVHVESGWPLRPLSYPDVV
jgi:hypothetical protein